MVTAELVRRVVDLFQLGLRFGGGWLPGQMCAEEVVCHALEPEVWNDYPPGVSPSVRTLLIGLNDTDWSTNRARADGLLALTVAQLGTAGTIDETEFVERVIQVLTARLIPEMFKDVASVLDEPHKSQLLQAADSCETESALAVERVKKE